MKSHPLFLLFLLLFLALLSPLSLQAQNASPQDAELTAMRQKLRDLAGQLQDAQNQTVTLQAQYNQDEADKQALQAKVDALSAQLKTTSDQATADKATLARQITDLTTQTTDQKGQLDRLNAALKQWKDAYNQAIQLAALNEAARKQYALQTALLQRTVDDREAKNLALYKLANEILTRYQQFGLGEALEAKEPFVGVSRVKLQNLVQDYKDKILDQAITSAPTADPTTRTASAKAP